MIRARDSLLAVFIGFALPPCQAGDPSDVPVTPLTLPAPAAPATPVNELSIGTIKEKAESAAVRLLGKLGDRLSIKSEFSPTMPAAGANYGTFDLVSRELSVDVADKGKFGGATFRYGIQHYLVGLKQVTTPAGKVIQTGNGALDIITAHFGADTDRSFKNRDVLLEVGYLPVRARQDTCFSMGFNPMFAAGLQAGKRYRTTDPEYVIKQGDTGGTLKRFKAEGRITFPLSCVGVKSRAVTSGGAVDTLFADLSQWSVRIQTENWRDFSESKTYHKHALVIRMPTDIQKNTYVDFRRDIGSNPVEFASGGKYGINLTLAF